MRNWLDNESFQLTAIAVASVSIVAVLTFLASRPPPEPQPVTANSGDSNSELGLSRPKLRKDAADQTQAPFAGSQVPPETLGEPEEQSPARKGGSFPSLTPDFWPPVFPDGDSTSERTEYLFAPKDQPFHRPIKAAVSVSSKALTHHKAAIRNEVPYGSLPNRKGENRLPETELQSSPFSDFLGF